MKSIGALPDVTKMCPPAKTPGDEKYFQGTLAVQSISGNANLHTVAGTPFRGMAFPGKLPGDCAPIPIALDQGKRTWSFRFVPGVEFRKKYELGIAKLEN